MAQLTSLAGYSLRAGVSKSSRNTPAVRLKGSRLRRFPPLFDPSRSHSMVFSGGSRLFSPPRSTSVAPRTRPQRAARLFVGPGRAPETPVGPRVTPGSPSGHPRVTLGSPPGHSRVTPGSHQGLIAGGPCGAQDTAEPGACATSAPQQRTVRQAHPPRKEQASRSRAHTRRPYDSMHHHITTRRALFVSGNS